MGMKVLKFIAAFLGIALVVFMPFIIDRLFAAGQIVPIISTRFDHVNILTYVGAILPLFATIIFSWLVLRQNKRLIDLQTQVHELEQNKILRDLADNTFTYLNIVRIETTADYYPVKTCKLEKAVPWPLDVRTTPLGYPNGIPQDFPRHWKKQLERELPSLPMGNTEDYREGEVVDKVNFSYKTETGQSWLSIDPSEGIFYAGNRSELVLWQTNFPLPRYYKYYTPFWLTFYAKSSRANFFVDTVEIHSLRLTLQGKDNKLYGFADRLHYFADIIRKPLIVKATTIAENSYYSKKYDCDHIFSIELHLCHDYTDLLDITAYNEIDIKLEAVYINQSGVRTRRQQGFIKGALIRKIVESQILDANGVPIKYKANEKVDLQHHTASDLSIDVNHSEVSHP